MQWAEIFRRLKQDRNDQSAWDELETCVRSWARPDLWNRGWTVVDDVVAETCAEVVMGLDRARGAETFAGFIRGHYLNARRRALVRVRARAESLDGLDPPAAPDEVGDAPEWDAMRRCFEDLAPRERTAVQLRYFETAASERIAEVLAVSPGNARRIVFNGLASLRRCVKQMLLSATFRE